MTCIVLLDYPRFPHNVGSALRACALLGAQHLLWTGDRVPDPDNWPEGARLPREERMRCYARTRMTNLPGPDVLTRPIQHVISSPGYYDLIPVCIEISDTAENLIDFVHPENALYIFGPEDGNVSRRFRAGCHRFVRIPNAIPEDSPDSRTPYNLAASVSLVLYDRLAKQRVKEAVFA